METKRKNPLFYISLILWLIWIFYTPFFEIATATTLIYFLTTWAEEDVLK